MEHTSVENKNTAKRSALLLRKLLLRKLLLRKLWLKNLYLGVSFALFHAVWTPTSHAQSYHGSVENPRHHGFFLRLTAGGSLFAVNEGFDDVTPAFRIGAGAATADVAVGGAITENLILHADFVSMLAIDPQYAIGEGGGTDDLDADLSLLGAGCGLTHYFMPINLYVSASVLMISAHLNPKPGRSTSDRGVAWKIMVGKEWWITKDWGIGIAGSLLLGLSSGDDIAERVVGTPIDEGHTRFTALSVLFSATYN